MHHTRLTPCVLLFTCLTLAAGQPAAAGTISTVAGTGDASRNGDRGKATTIHVKDPFGVEIGPDGALYITEVGHHRVLRVDRNTGLLTTVAGTGVKGYAGDGGLATQARLNEPYEVRFDTAGDMYFVEMQNHLVRRVDAKTNVISTVAGTGKPGNGGDGGPATQATLRRPHSIALDGRGNLYIADIGNHRIRRVDLKAGTIHGFAGNGAKQLPRAGKLTADDPLLGPRALFIRDATMWIALREGHSVWKLDLATRQLQHLAGTGQKGFSGDGQDARAATFNGPKGIAVDRGGNIYVVDTENQAIRMIAATSGTVATVAGKGPQYRGGEGDGGPATEAELARPHGICVDADGRLYIGDTLNHRVRRVDP